MGFEYSSLALQHLTNIGRSNEVVSEKIVTWLVENVPKGKKLFVFGSGHSSLFSLELFHRAGGASFVIPMVGEHLMPQAGPPVIRVTERTPGAAIPIYRRALPEPGEMIWIMSQSGINAASVDVAIEAKKDQLVTVAFTSVVHSSAVAPRHPSKKKLFELCDWTVDLGGVVGDAIVPIRPGLQAGSVSLLGSVFLGNTIITEACARLEAKGYPCVYTSVNTPEGESRNREIEKEAAIRDPLLRG